MRRPIAVLERFVSCSLCLSGRAPGVGRAAKDGTQQTAAPKSRVKAVGTIKSITGNTIAITTDTGAEVSVIIQPSTRLVRSVPGQTDLKSASPIQVQDLQVGDRLLAGGTAVRRWQVRSGHHRDRHEEGRRRREAAAGSRRVAEARRRRRGKSGRCRQRKRSRFLPARWLRRTLAIHVSKNTVIRRYAPDSVKFDDAKPGTLDQIKPGDQLRARGTRSADGSELTADEIVSGTFRNIAGTVVSTDQGNSSVTVTDLVSKRPGDPENNRRFATA